MGERIAEEKEVAKLEKQLEKQRPLIYEQENSFLRKHRGLGLGGVSLYGDGCQISDKQEPGTLFTLLQHPKNPAGGGDSPGTESKKSFSNDENVRRRLLQLGAGNVGLLGAGMVLAGFFGYRLFRWWNSNSKPKHEE